MGYANLPAYPYAPFGPFGGAPHPNSEHALTGERGLPQSHPNNLAQVEGIAPKVSQGGPAGLSSSKAEVVISSAITSQTSTSYFSHL